jgi:hypothetical protein
VGGQYNPGRRARTGGAGSPGSAGPRAPTQGFFALGA